MSYLPSISHNINSLSFSIHVWNSSVIQALLKDNIRGSGYKNRHALFQFLCLFTNCIKTVYDHKVFEGTYAFSKIQLGKVFSDSQYRSIYKGKHWFNQLFTRYKFGSNQKGHCNAYKPTELCLQIIEEVKANIFAYGLQEHIPKWSYGKKLFDSEPIPKDKYKPKQKEFDLLLPCFVTPEALETPDTRLFLAFNGPNWNNPHVNQFYTRKPSGRLYCTGLNLQTINKNIRNQVLLNQHSYDIECCAPNILYQIYLRTNTERLHELESYINDRSLWRHELANFINVKTEIVKKILQPLFFGGQALYPQSDPCLELVGSGLSYYEAFRRVNLARENPMYARLTKDVDRLFNFVDTSSVPADIKERNKRVAFLYQQEESQVMGIVQREFINEKANLSLLLHDGFTCDDEIHITAIEKTIKLTTGYTVKYDHSLIDLKCS